MPLPSARPGISVSRGGGRAREKKQAAAVGPSNHPQGRRRSSSRKRRSGRPAGSDRDRDNGGKAGAALLRTRGMAASPAPRNAVHCSLPSASPARPTPPKDPRGSIAFQAARLLGPPARFQASKLKVVFLGKEGKQRRRQQQQPLCSFPRTYALTHCDLTANLTLAVFDDSIIDQWRKWQNKIQKDDVVAEWKRVKEEPSLHVHCYVGGANFFQDLAAEFRYYIFCKELPLVLNAVLHGDSPFFLEHPELLDASVWVYFHSSSGKFNRLEFWGPLKEATQRTLEDQLDGLKDSSMDIKLDWRSSETILNALVTFFL